MRRSLTAVIEQGNSYEGAFSTEPYEAGWASEARWFVRILDGEGGGEDGGGNIQVTAQPEISPDGLVWLAADCVPLRMPAVANTMASCSLDRFGSWLRLDIRPAGPPRKVKYLIYLVLKE
jgi:hypothetical protein